jgi:hypothetical protein
MPCLPEASGRKVIVLLGVYMLVYCIKIISSSFPVIEITHDAVLKTGGYVTYTFPDGQPLGSWRNGRETGLPSYVNMPGGVPLQ